MSALKQQLQDDMKAAMRAKADGKAQLAAIRLILAAMKQREVDERITLTDEDVIAILNKMQKQRRDSIEQYQSAGRDDLVAQEQFELDIIQTYLPKPLSEEEVLSIIKTAISETQAATPKDMGKVMAVLKSQLNGRADMTVVSKTVKEQLTE